MVSLSRLVSAIFACAIIAGCQHQLEPTMQSDPAFWLEDSFTDAENIYERAVSGDEHLFDSAIDKFNLVLVNDLEHCFEDAYFYLANIHLIRRDTEQARKILKLGKDLYSGLDDGGCVQDILERFDLYLNRMQPDPQLGRSTSFVPYDEPPRPVAGFGAIQRELEYPKDALEARAEGRAIIQVLVDCFGRPCITRVMAQAPLQSMDNAARKAVKAVEWQPAQLHGEPARVWVVIPVIFRLK